LFISVGVLFDLGLGDGFLGRGSQKLRNQAFTYKDKHNEREFDLFKCRLCKTCLSNPDELRIHSMVKHKGHMLPSIKNC
jgi:hypothetical protein